MFEKKQITNTPDKRRAQPTFIACECFYGQLTNCSKQVLQRNENTVRTFSGATTKVWAHGVYTEPSQSAAHPAHCTRASTASADGAGMQHSKLGDIKLMTKRWWQTSRQQGWDCKHDWVQTERAKQGSPDAVTNPQSCNSHAGILRICLKMQTGSFLRQPLRLGVPGQAEPSSVCALTAALQSHEPLTAGASVPQHLKHNTGTWTLFSFLQC